MDLCPHVQKTSDLMGQIERKSQKLVKNVMNASLQVTK